jgi:hypothetical protein
MKGIGALKMKKAGSTVTAVLASKHHFHTHKSSEHPQLLLAL